MVDNLPEQGYQRYFEIQGREFVDKGRYFSARGNQRWFNNPTLLAAGLPAVLATLIFAVALGSYKEAAVHFIQGVPLSAHDQEGLWTVGLTLSLLGGFAGLGPLINGIVSVEHSIIKRIQASNLRHSQGVFLFPS